MARWVKVPGIVLVGGLPEANVSVSVFSPGTTTKIPIYEDQGLTAKDNPFLTDETGAFFFFINADSYPKIRLYFEKTGVDFTSMNLLYDGITLP